MLLIGVVMQWGQIYSRVSRTASRKAETRLLLKTNYDSSCRSSSETEVVPRRRPEIKARRVPNQKTMVLRCPFDFWLLLSLWLLERPVVSLHEVMPWVELA